MSFEDVRARLNLFAVLPNLEDVVREDAEMRALVADASISVNLTVANGPGTVVRFAGGACSVGPQPRRDEAGGPAPPAPAGPAPPCASPSPLRRTSTRCSTARRSRSRSGASPTSGS